MNVGVNIAANFLGRAYSMAAIYLFVPFYISILGIDAYGLIAFYSILLALGFLADAGLSAAFSREAAREENPARLLDLLTTIERVLLGASLLFAVLVYLGADYIASTWLNASEALPTATLAISLQVMAFTVPMQLGVSLYVAGLYGLQRQGRANGLQALYTTVRGGLVIPAMYAMPDITFFFAWQLASGALLLIVSRVVLVRTLGFAAFSFGAASLAVLRPVMHFAGGILAITILLSINTQIDKVVVNRLFTIADFGYYSLAWTLSLLPTAVAAPIMMALFPRLANLVGRHDDEVGSRLYDACTYVIASIGAVCGFGLLLFAPEVVTLWLGMSHATAALIETVRVLAVAGLLSVLQMAPYNFCLAHGHSKTSVGLGLVTLALIAPLVYLTADRYGLPGAAMPWIALNAMTFLVLALVVKRKFYIGNGWRWFAGSVGLPLMCAGTAVALGRLAADTLDSSTIAAGAWGGASGLAALAFLGLLAWRRSNWLAIRQAVHPLEQPR